MADGRSGARHVPALDGLRGIAILLVLILHATEALDRVHPVGPTLLGVTNVGFTGVDLFFVLSGFLISGILLDAKGAPGYFRTFYARRTLRIFPLYYAYLALVFLVLPLVSSQIRDNYAELRQHQGWYWFYLSNVFNAIQGGWRVDGGLTGHFWSLAIEEQFYLVWPAIVLLLSAKGLRNACIAIILGVPVLRFGLRMMDVNPVAVYVLTICRVDALAIGALLAVALRDERMRAQLRRLALPAMAVTALGVAVIGAWRGGFGQFDLIVATVGYSAWALFYGSVLLTALTSPARAGWLPDVLSAGWLRFFGKYSYAMYVFHRPLSGLAESVVPYAVLSERIGAVGAGVVFVTSILVATTLAALFSWWLLESRFIALKDRFSYATRTPRTVTRET